MFKLFVCLLLFSGCQLTPGELSGIWTGKVGPFNSAFKFNDQGVGLFCYSGRKAYKIEWAKYSNGVIKTERKTDVIIKSLNNGVLIIEVDNFGVREYTFNKDDELKNASWFCREKLGGEKWGKVAITLKK